MRILFIHPSVELYGADKILLYILELLNDGNEITVLLPKDGILVNYIKGISEKIKVVINNELPIVYSSLSKKEIIFMPFKILSFQRLFKKNSFDLIYCNTLATIFLLFTNWSKQKIIHVHEIIENRVYNAIFSILMMWGARKVICVSEHVKGKLLFSKKYIVIHNGIPDIKKNKIQRTTNKKITFVLPGRYMEKKGQWFLLKTLNVIEKKKLDQTEFYLYGSPPPNRMNYQIELGNLIMDYGLSDIVHLNPFMENISEIYDMADVILVPSIMADPFPTTVLEAMMFGKPIISTNHGGASEIIEDSFGKLIEPNNVEQFKSAIITIIDNKNQLKKMGIFARKKYEDYLTLDCFKKRFMEIF